MQIFFLICIVASISSPFGDLKKYYPEKSQHFKFVDRQVYVLSPDFYLEFNLYDSPRNFPSFPVVEKENVKYKKLKWKNE